MNIAVTSKYWRFIRPNISIHQNVSPYCTKSKEPTIPENPFKDMYSANRQKETGKVYDKKPFKIRCVAGKQYFWCLCGESKTQPFCDGTHRNIFLKIKLRPILFSVTETKDYWLCNCKQTANRPFCDGSHKLLAP